MAKFKVIVSDPSTSKSKVVELEGARAVPLIGRRLGETIDGSVMGMAGMKLQLTGGSDKDGFPMRPDVHGGVRVSIIISKSVGFHPTREGERQRKTLRGNVITEEIVQINMKVSEKAKKTEKPKREKKLKAEASTDEEEAVAEPKSPEEPDKAQRGQAQHVAIKTGGESSEETAQAARG